MARYYSAHAPEIDQEMFRWAGRRGRRIVTENVKDFRPVLRRAEESGVTRGH